MRLSLPSSFHRRCHFICELILQYAATPYSDKKRERERRREVFPWEREEDGTVAVEQRGWSHEHAVCLHLWLLSCVFFFFFFVCVLYHVVVALFILPLYWCTLHSGEIARTFPLLWLVQHVSCYSGSVVALNPLYRFYMPHCRSFLLL